MVPSILLVLNVLNVKQQKVSILSMKIDVLISLVGYLAKILWLSYNEIS